MELKQVRCTNCGFPATLDLTQKQHTCAACGSSFLTIQAHHLDTKSEVDIDIVKNNRQNLKRAILSNDLNAILNHMLFSETNSSLSRFLIVWQL